MIVLIAGIGVLLAGLVAIGLGIQDKEFEVGRTLILPVRPWPAPASSCSAFPWRSANCATLRGVSALPVRQERRAPKLNRSFRWPARINRRRQTRDGAEPAAIRRPAAPWQDDAGGAGPRADWPTPQRARNGPAGAGRADQAQAQSAVFVVAPGARTRGAPARCTRRRSRPRAAGPARRHRKKQLRRPLRMPGRKRTGRGPTHCGVPVRLRPSPSRMLRPRPMPERAAPTAARSEEPAAGDGAQIRRRRRHGLFAVFRWFDRGADAGGHDAVRLHRRTALASRSAPASVFDFRKKLAGK